MRDKRRTTNIEVISAPLTICGYPNFPDKLVHFQGKYPIFTKIVVDGSLDRTTRKYNTKKCPEGLKSHQ